MERNPAPFDRVHWTRKTDDAKYMFTDLVKTVEKATTDAEQALRLAKHICITCHYIRGRIGGAAMTTQPCSCCLTPVMYSSTATDELCLPCAQEHKLCKRCGGDLEMRTGRRNWPEPRTK